MNDDEEVEFDDYHTPTLEEVNRYLGKSHTFEDGDKIEVTQLKRRDSGWWVTYNIYQGPGIPRRLLMVYEEFVGTFGHLFE